MPIPSSNWRFSPVAGAKTTWESDVLKNTQMLLQELKGFADPHHRIDRMVRNGQLVRLKRGLYSDTKLIFEPFLAGVLCAPSYLSFQSALSCYDLIPEAVPSWTSATLGKRRQKVYETPVGFFFYQDIPQAAFPWEVMLCTEFDVPFFLASAEKALCDQLYTLKPLSNQKDLEYMLFEDMRIEEEDFLALNLKTLCELAPLYHKKNLDLLYRYTRRRA